MIQATTLTSPQPMASCHGQPGGRHDPDRRSITPTPQPPRTADLPVRQGAQEAGAHVPAAPGGCHRKEPVVTERAPSTPLTGTHPPEWLQSAASLGRPACAHQPLNAHSDCLRVWWDAESDVFLQEAGPSPAASSTIRASASWTRSSDGTGTPLAISAGSPWLLKSPIGTAEHRAADAPERLSMPLALHPVFQSRAQAYKPAKPRPEPPGLQSRHYVASCYSK